MNYELLHPPRHAELNDEMIGRGIQADVGGYVELEIVTYLVG